MLDIPPKGWQARARMGLSSLEKINKNANIIVIRISKSIDLLLSEVLAKQ